MRTLIKEGPRPLLLMSLFDACHLVVGLQPETSFKSKILLSFGLDELKNCCYGSSERSRNLSSSVHKAVDIIFIYNVHSATFFSV